MSKNSDRFKGLTSKPDNGDRQNALLEQMAAASSSTRKLLGALIVPLEMLVPNTQQARRFFNEESLQELAEDIKVHGILEPLLVRETLPSQYEILAGERRYRAAKLAELTEVPVLVKQLDDKQARLVTLAENLQRENLRPEDEQYFYRQLQNEFNYSITEIARLISKSRAYVRDRLEGKKIQTEEVIPVSEKNNDTQIFPELNNISQSDKASQVRRPPKFSTAFKRLSQALEDTLLSLDQQPLSQRENRQQLKESVIQMEQRLQELKHKLVSLDENEAVSSTTPE
ncbi:MAG: ParB/RepB/Spo0J family partition protein [Chloroflexi bacterium]|nr:ParB/RepB/Spo0J family partition protein [Chloroflexota bacterium]